jgi:MOSC domain-containing protein YiiM
MPNERGVIESLAVSDGGVPKLPIGAAMVRTTGVEGDRQRNLQHHGGPDRAVCLYSAERLEALGEEGHQLGPGVLGENVLISGLDWDAVVPGAILDCGEVVLEITSYAAPCSTIREGFNDGNSNRISQKLHPGWSRVYARVLNEGVLSAGFSVTLRGPIVPSGD